VHEAVSGRLKATFHDLGSLVLKNIERPVQAFDVTWEALDWKVTATTVATPSIATTPAADLPLALPDKPSIAVLPFQNVSGDAEQEYFVDGITKDIIAALSRIPSLFVIARNSSFAYKGKAIDVRQIGRELGVRYVMEGSVRKSGQRLRVTGQLIATETGAHLWADKFDSVLEDVFDLQDRVPSPASSSPRLRRPKSCAPIASLPKACRPMTGCCVPWANSSSFHVKASMVRCKRRAAPSNWIRATPGHTRILRAGSTNGRSMAG
jgi:adenylate cyclase